MDYTPLDGNAAAGMLSDIFTTDVTLARTCCASCGASHPVGELRAYMQAPGLVLRCNTCDAAQIRVVRATERAWMDFSGMRSIELRISPDSGFG